MQDAAIERFARIVSDKSPDSGSSRPRRPALHIHLGLSEGWFSLFLLTTIVYSTIWCVQAADWVNNLGILSLTTALGLMAGVIAAKQQKLPRLAVHIIAVGLGLVIAFWQTAGADYAGSTVGLLNGLHQWFLIAIGGGVSSDDSIFLLLITVLGFILAYTSAWLLYRTRSPWLLIVANAIVLLINLNNVAPGYVVFLVVFLMASLLLLLRFNLYESMQKWRRQHLHFADDLGWDFMQAGAIISIGVLVVSWILPWGYINETVSQIWNASANPYIQLENTWNRLISINTSFTPSNHGNFSDTLALGGNPNLNNDIVFTVQTDDGTQYLASESFESYDTVRGWTIGPTYTTPIKASELIDNGASDRRPIRQEITVVNPPGEQRAYLFGAPDISEVNTATQLATSSANGSVITWARQSGNLGAGDHYTVISEVSSASKDTLRTVPFPADAPSIPTNLDVEASVYSYDPNIVHTYTQLPNLDPNILELAQSIVAQAHATTMYDQAEALATYLQQNYRYDVNVQRPAGQDGVEWFLFQSHRGYCNYFASAMAIMARLLGMPARVVDGYTNGTYDPKQGKWIIRGKDAHAWTQIYFAGYGWINFEPSAGFSPFLRPLTSQTTLPTDTCVVFNNCSSSSSTKTSTSSGHGHIPIPGGGSFGSSTDTSSTGTQWSQRLTLSLALFALAIALAVALFTLWWQRLFRNRSIAAQIYGRLCLLGNWAGISIRPSQTPYERINTLATITPQHADTLERLGDIYVRDVWADPASKEHPRRTGETDEMPALWKRLQPALFLYVARHPYFLRWLPLLILSFSRRLVQWAPLHSDKPEVQVEEELDMEEMKEPVEI